MSARQVFRVLASLALLMGPSLALAQTGTVTGTITESRANQPVGGARVQALSATTVVAATQSREDGTYRLTVPAGSYTIVVNRIGYRPGNATVTVSAGVAATANVVLTERVVELNPVVTTASRKEEKALSAPASVSVIEVREIQERPAVTAADHVQGIAGVDVSKGGVAQSNIVARGFNNAFSGSILALQDYRFAGVPSLRVNVPLLFTSTNEDIERIEVLLGPASALYGPNSSHGVLHVITKSPFTSQGTTLTVDGGTRSLFRGAVRHAAVVGNNFGFKLSGEMFQASDFRFEDPGEPDVFPSSAPAGRAGQPNDRSFDIKRWVGEARMDYRPDDNSEYVTTLGMSKIGSGLEYTTSNGTALAKNWTFISLQQRARVGRLFGQVFLNMSDAGNENGQSLDGTYLLRSGQPIVDQSKSWAAQLQHGITLGSRQDFVYGVDYIYTNPRTANTINGRNEDIDNVREVGGYIQSTSNLTSKVDFIAALRVDKNDQVDGVQTSPRAAIIFKPSETQNFRLTYNRAFQTPANFTWFLDLISSARVAGPTLPYNIRALGNPPKTGWTFNRTCNASVNGGLCMRSIFTPDSSAWVPAGAHAAYPGVVFGNRVALAAALVPGITGGLMAAPFNMPQAQASGAANILAPAIVGILASQQPTATQVGTQMRMIAPGSPVLTAANVQDIGPIKASFNNTYELGYKGIIGNKLRLSVDLWREERGDVGNPAGLATPNVFFDRTSLQTFIATALAPQLADTMRVRLGFTAQQAAAAAAGFSPVIAGQISGTFAPLPLGIVSFNSPTFASATDIYATYTSYDTTITVNGIDLALDFVANSNWTFGATMSWVDNDSFPEVTSSNSRPLMLNAPSNKLSASSRYSSTSGGWGFDARVRHATAYPVNSGVYATGVDFRVPGSTDTYRYADIDAATIFDLGFNWRLLRGGRDFLFSVRADNVFDTKYRTMPGTPALGMLLVTRLQYSFR